MQGYYIEPHEAAQDAAYMSLGIRESRVIDTDDRSESTIGSSISTHHRELPRAMSTSALGAA